MATEKLPEMLKREGEEQHPASSVKPLSCGSGLVLPSALSFTHRIFHPPKLERKHSSGDLHSRLKTRKILGVGETDNGDIHRSKISQLLGHNEHLYVKFPRGFWIWHLILASLLTIQGFLAVILPRHFHFLVTEEESDETTLGPDAIFATRLNGATLLGMAVFVWSSQGTTEKAQARVSLAAITTYTLLQLFVNAAWLLHYQSSLSASTIGFLITRAFVVLVSIGYYHCIGRSTAGLRKSASYKDLVTADVKKELAVPSSEERKDL
ncbi:hypothetical protein CHUAL_011650 [Chamberlinius hualienensis]